MKNLVIGKTSQLGYYFPDENHVKISSRDIDYNYLNEREWNKVYILFAEQRTFLANDYSKKNIFDEVNWDLTVDVVNRLKKISRKIVYFSTAELWNKTSGPVKVGDKFDFHENNYTLSKLKITEELMKKSYRNVSVVYPFNFNSVYRKGGYLFSKIFESIINKKRIEIGDTHYYRDILHPKTIVDFCIGNNFEEKNIIVGSGRLFHINDFIKKLYCYYQLPYSEFVNENCETPSIYRKNIFYSLNGICGEKGVFEETIDDISLRGEELYGK